MVNRLSSQTFASTAPTKSSLTTDGRPLRGSSCTLSRPSLNFLIHFLTIPSLMAFSPYTSHIWLRISAGFAFLAFRKRIVFTVGGALDHLEHFKHTEQGVNTICFSHIGDCGLPVNEGRQRAWAKSRLHSCGGNIPNTANIRALEIQATAVPFYEGCKNQIREFLITEKQNMWIFENLVIISFIGAPNLLFTQWY